MWSWFRINDIILSRLKVFSKLITLVRLICSVTRGQSYKADFGINYIKNGFNQLKFTLNYINFDVIYIKLVYKMDPMFYCPPWSMWIQQKLSCHVQGLQWGSEIRTSLDFKWSKEVGLQLVQTSGRGGRVVSAVAWQSSKTAIMLWPRLESCSGLQYWSLNKLEIIYQTYSNSRAPGDNCRLQFNFNTQLTDSTHEIHT